MRDVHLFVVDTMADWEPGYAIAHIQRGVPGQPARYRVRTVGLTREPVRTMGGVTIVPDMTVEEMGETAMLILPGSERWAEESVAPVLVRARELVEAGVPVAAICGATLGLARAGVLDERRHTSNAPEFLAASGYRGGERYVAEPAVEDRGVITASGVAPLEFARLVLGRLSLYPERALEAWYLLFKTGRPEHYQALVAAFG